MNIQSVFLRGMTGIKKGMGLDEISLDFSNMEGLIALAGPTGIGKSTIIEALHPYPRLVSRPNPSLKNHCFLRDSVKELSFLHGGDHFRTLTKIDAQTGRTEGYIYLNHSEKSENDGKITSYKNVISEMFGSTELFFNSVFCAQGSEKMSSMDPADLRSLFVEFLGRRLEILVEQEDTSKACAKELLTAIAIVDNQIKVQADLIELYKEVPSDINRITAERAAGVKAAAILSAQIEKHIELRTGYQDQEKRQAVHLVSISDLEAAQGDEGESIYHIKDALENETKLINAEYQTVESTIADLNVILEEKEAVETAGTRAKTLNGEIAAANIERDDRMKQAVIDRATLEKEQKEARDLIDGHKADVGLLNDKRIILEKSVLELAAEIKSKTASIEALKDDTNLRMLKAKLVQLKDAAADLDKRGTVTCGDAQEGIDEFPCNTNNCMFVEKALKAKEAIPNLEIEIDEKESDIKRQIYAFGEGLDVDKQDHINALQKITEIGSSIAALTEEYDKLKEEVFERGTKTAAGVRKLEENIDRLRIEILDKNQQVEKLAAMAEKAPQIKISEERKADFVESLLKINGRLSKVTLKANAEVHVLEEKIASYAADIEKLRKDINPDIDILITGIAVRIAEEDDVLDALENKNALQDAELIRLKLLGEQLGTAERAFEGLAEKRAHLAMESSEWLYIQGKCSATGIRALEINSVAPSIAYVANQLLASSFGAQAMVNLQTLDSEGREVLRMVAIDQDGEEVLVQNRSGGQQRYALKAMRLAMTIISKEKSGRDYKSSFADEEDDGLSPDAAVKFTQLYRSFLEQGGFDKAFYISHKEHCVALADHIIRLGPGGVLE